ncbi:site-2 protease family protein [Thermodesulfovibrionales bacterium]|nr:site-2 protease family protein [Thermodesulfovibrionales bacterium]
MNGSLQAGSIKVAVIMGIPLMLHFSWFIIFGLLTWGLAALYFPNAAPQFPVWVYWASGAITALLLFASVVFHELAHSFVALGYKLQIVNITLFIFGGVAQIKGEPPTPKAEFNIAIVGPLSSFFLALVFFIIYNLTVDPIANALFWYLALLNLILAIFNLIPGFPMDGGRLVRAFIWKRTNDFFHATRSAARLGKNISLFFMIFGLIFVFFGIAIGLWLILIGWFLYMAADASYQQADLQETLNNIKVQDVMTRDIISVPSNMTIDTVINEYFLRYGYGGFPVMDYGKFFGFVTLKETKNIPRERWKYVKMSEIFIPHDKRLEVSEKNPALKALEIMLNEDKGRLLVTDKGNIVGLITRNGIARYLQVMGKH